MCLENAEQSDLARALLAIIDKRRPLKTHDVINVLTRMLAHCVIVHAHNYAGAKNTMAGIVHLMSQMLLEANLAAPPEESVPPDTRH